MIKRVSVIALRLKCALDDVRHYHWLERLRYNGMQIGEDVLLPLETSVDLASCHLITIGDSCSFGPEVMLLAHEALATPFLGAVRVGRIVLHESCHIGARAVLLPGIEIGPRTIVAACSVVTRTLPPNSVCAGNPARPVSTIHHYLESHRARLVTAARFPYAHYGRIDVLNAAQRAALLAAVASGDAYMMGGRTEELRSSGGSFRTPLRHHRPVPPESL